MKLVIISHTAHYISSDGTLVGWGPTITEINHLIDIFDEIYHIAVLTDEEAPKSALPYNSDRINFVPLKKVGGPKLSDKIKILLQMPSVIFTVKKTLRKVDVFQFRAPTGMGVYLIPYLNLFSRKKGWFKYAGNWKEENAAIGFALQRWMLKKQNRKVSINGNWANQEKQCIPFENPCLTQQHRIDGEIVVNEKICDKKLNFCFVGTFNKSKGIDIILKALKQINHPNMGTFYFIGDGGEVKRYKQIALNISVKTNFTGFLSKEETHKIYKKCHFIVLPSENEGFPKVIGEAMNYGCIPIVSNVSCIGQYIFNDKNGYLIEPNDSITLLKLMNKNLIINKSKFIKIISLNFDLADKFTYDYYNKQIQQKIIEK